MKTCNSLNSKGTENFHYVALILSIEGLGLCMLSENMLDFMAKQGKFQALLAVALFMFKIEFWVKHAHQ